MNTIAYVVAAAFFFTACSPKETPSTSPREFADKYVAAENKAWNTGDLSDLKALEDENAVFHLGPIDLKGWKAHEEYIVKSRPTVSDLKQNWKYLSGEGNHIVMGYDSSATLKATDKSPAQATSNNYLFVLRLQDGKVAEIWANGSQTSKPPE